MHISSELADKGVSGCMDFLVKMGPFLECWGYGSVRLMNW
jgi:hypothetical protein